VRQRGRPRARSIQTLGIALALLVAGCGVPNDGTPREIDARNVPFSLLAPTAGATSTTAPSALAPMSQVTIYLADAEGNLIAVQREVRAPGTVRKALEVLLRGPTTDESDTLRTAITSATKLLHLSGPEDGLVTIDLSHQLLDVTGRQQILALAQVVYTATSRRNVERVLFRVDGEPKEVPTGDGTLTASPLDRLSYSELIAD
jgi:spore germination protein GerM